MNLSVPTTVTVIGSIVVVDPPQVNLENTLWCKPSPSIPILMQNNNYFEYYPSNACCTYSYPFVRIYKIVTQDIVDCSGATINAQIIKAIDHMCYDCFRCKTAVRFGKLQISKRDSPDVIVLNETAFVSAPLHKNHLFVGECKGSPGHSIPPDRQGSIRDPTVFGTWELGTFGSLRDKFKDVYPNMTFDYEEFPNYEFKSTIW